MLLYPVRLYTRQSDLRFKLSVVTLWDLLVKVTYPSKRETRGRNIQLLLIMEPAWLHNLNIYCTQRARISHRFASFIRRNFGRMCISYTNELFDNVRTTLNV
jgi:hypothetical protein